MLFPRGNKHNKGFMRELADILCQQYAVQRGNINIQKNGVNAVVLEIFQHVQTIVKRADNLHLAVLFYQPAQFLLGQEFIFNNDDFHDFTPG